MACSTNRSWDFSLSLCDSCSSLGTWWNSESTWKHNGGCVYKCASGKSNRTWKTHPEWGLHHSRGFSPVLYRIKLAQHPHSSVFLCPDCRDNSSCLCHDVLTVPSNCEQKQSLPSFTYFCQILCLSKEKANKYDGSLQCYQTALLQTSPFPQCHAIANGLHSSSSNTTHSFHSFSKKISKDHGIGI